MGPGALEGGSKMSTGEGTIRYRCGLGFHRFKLDRSTVSYNGHRHSVRGARAECTTSGFLLTRRSHLTVIGPDYAWTAPLATSTRGSAQRFAAKVNTAAMALKA
jgi:hypothetical protein